VKIFAESGKNTPHGGGWPMTTLHITIPDALAKEA
jgi:hypothetical protein